MTLSKKFVQDLFNNLEIGQQDNFFKHVADNVLWHVMGTHPLAGVYHGKDDFKSHTFVKLNKLLQGGVVLKVQNIFVDDPVAIIEMMQVSTTNKGQPFNNTYCWVVKFNDEIITEVRAYLDSALVQQLFLNNQP